MSDATATKETPAKDQASQETSAKANPKAPSKKKTTARKTERKAPVLKIVDSGKVRTVPIATITTYDNPRKEPENLYEVGYVLIGDPKNETFEPNDDGEWMLKKVGQDEPQAVEDAFDEANFVSLVHMALSDDIEQARRYVGLIDEHESVNRKEDPNADQTVQELAHSMQVYDQLVPCLVRPSGKNFTGIDGGRRIAAKLYLHCLSRIAIADKKPHPWFGEKVPSKSVPATIDVTERKCKENEVFLLSVEANLARKRFTPLQEGRVYNDMLQQINPSTEKKWTMKEAADHLGVNYGTFRNRQALWREPEYDDDGKQVKGLTDNQRQKVANGEMLATAASRKSLGEKHYAEDKDGKPAEKRAKAIPLAAMQKKFDETAEANTERRQAIAECMGLTLAQAVKESNKRIEEIERQEMSGRGGRGKAA